MDRDVAVRALAALDEVRGLLQAAQFAAKKFEQQVAPDPLEAFPITSLARKWPRT
jgi:hypothetical protein